MSSNVVSIRPAARRGKPAVRHGEDAQPVLDAYISAFEAGVTEMPARASVTICMFLGQSVEVTCTRNGRVRHGREVTGDLDIVPAHTPCAWETGHAGTSLVMRVPEALLRQVAVASNLDPAHVEIADRFQLRDPLIEHIGWALKAHLESGGPAGHLYFESLGTAVAARLLHRHNARSLPMRDSGTGLGVTKLKQLLAYIEDNIEGDLSLAEIARRANLSVSHLNACFRQSTGLPVHQYVLRRRIERAKELLLDADLSITEIALATGFAHQSHLARHMRRILGVTPASVRKSSG
jgi:AraC family transcriptional regulator